MTLPENKLWPPTVLVFLVGTVKYTERTCALYLASLDSLVASFLPKPEPGLDYEETSTKFASRWMLRFRRHAKLTGIPNIISVDDGGIALKSDFDESELLQVSKDLFERFKGLIVGLFLTNKDREFSRSLFLKITDHRCAVRVVENEFSFMFHVLHTKVVVMHNSVGYVLRAFSFSSLLGASIYFFHVEKRGFGRLDIILTYALLIGAVVLDVISLIKLIFSDFTLVVLKKSWKKCVPEIFLKRSKWSRLVFQYNLIDYCLDERPKWLYKLAALIHLSGTLDKIKTMWCSSSENVTEELKKFIFDDLKKKSENARSLRDAVQASVQRGDLALSQSPFATEIKLKWSVGEFQYTESLLLWHIATEIVCHLNEKSSGTGYQENYKRKHCKILSDYMFYVLIMQPNMLSTILGNWYIVFQDTYAEAKRFFSKHSKSERSKEELYKKLSSEVKFRPAAVKGTKSKSVFFDACFLAQQLQGLDDDRWEIMDRIWMELMCYAAINCRPIIHAQQPSRGGELLTFTWLLMNHFGLGIQFSEQEEQAGAETMPLY